MILFVRTLLAGILAEAISVLPDGGQPGCLCITPQQASSIPNAPGGWLVAASSNSSNASFLYGIGVCAAHDATPPRDPACDVWSPPSWCFREWCYVKSNCSVARLQSTVRLGFFYSYATCGFLDSSYHNALSVSALAGATVRTVHMTNTGGWQGSYCVRGEGCQGSIVEMVNWMLNYAGAQEHVIAEFYGGSLAKYPGAYPSAVMTEILRDNPNLTSTFDACTYATGMGYVDICIGSFSQKLARLERSEFFTIVAEQIVLMARKKAKKRELTEVMLRAFKPFHGATWAAIIGVILLISSCIVFTEASEEGAYNQWSLPVSMLHASYRGLRSFFGGGNEHDPVHPAACMVSLGLVFFLLLTVSAYTANLATMLIVKDRSIATVNSWQEVINNPSIFVCGHPFQEDIVVQKGLDRTRFIKVTSRNVMMTNIGSDTCLVGVGWLQDLEKMQWDTLDCSLVKVGDPLTAVHTGLPVSRKLGRALRLVAIRGQRAGKWMEFVDKHRPADVCKAQLEEEERELQEQGMRVEDIVGPIIISALFCAAGLVFLVIEQAILPRIRRLRGEPPKENSQLQLDPGTEVLNSATEVSQDVGELIEDMSRQMQNMMRKEDIDRHMENMMQHIGDLKRELKGVMQLRRF